MGYLWVLLCQHITQKEQALLRSTFGSSGIKYALLQKKHALLRSATMLQQCCNILLQHFVATLLQHCCNIVATLLQHCCNILKRTAPKKHALLRSTTMLQHCCNNVAALLQHFNTHCSGVQQCCNIVATFCCNIVATF